MRLDLQYPFVGRWRLGYLIECPDKRKRVFLFNNKDDRFGLTYAKYLMSVMLGRILRPDEQVDHIDEDRTNDDPSNLQILTAEQNRIKSERHRALLREKGRVTFHFNCPECGKPKQMLADKYVARLKTGIPPTCSKSCSAKLQFKLGKSSLGNKKKHLNPEQEAMIAELRKEGHSDCVIAEMLNIARSKIFRFRKENGIV